MSANQPTVFTDFLGEEVAVGDYIFYTTTSKYRESKLCVITRFTKKLMMARVLKVDTNLGIPNVEIAVKASFIKLSDEQVIMYKLKYY